MSINQNFRNKETYPMQIKHKIKPASGGYSLLVIRKSRTRKIMYKKGTINNRFHKRIVEYLKHSQGFQASPYQKEH